MEYNHHSLAANFRHAEPYGVSPREDAAPSVWLTGRDWSRPGEVIMIRLSACPNAVVPAGNLAEAPLVYWIKRARPADSFATQNAGEAVAFLQRLGVANAERLVEQVRRWRAVELLEQ